MVDINSGGGQVLDVGNGVGLAAQVVDDDIRIDE